jgi:hypothetical protein
MPFHSFAAHAADFFDASAFSHASPLQLSGFRCRAFTFAYVFPDFAVSLTFSILHAFFMSVTSLRLLPLLPV